LYTEDSAVCCEPATSARFAGYGSIHRNQSCEDNLIGSRPGRGLLAEEWRKVARWRGGRDECSACHELDLRGGGAGFSQSAGLLTRVLCQPARLPDTGRIIAAWPTVAVQDGRIVVVGPSTAVVLDWLMSTAMNPRCTAACPRFERLGSVGCPVTYRRPHEVK